MVLSDRTAQISTARFNKGSSFLEIFILGNFKTSLNQNTKALTELKNTAINKQPPAFILVA